MAARPICIGIKTNGVQCDKHTIVGEQRCRIHLNTVHNNGPNTNAINELKYRHRRLLREINARWETRIEEEPNHIVRLNLQQDFQTEYRIIMLQQNHEINLLERAQQDRVRETGIDPDEQARQRRAEQNRIRIEERANIRRNFAANNAEVDMRHRVLARQLLEQLDEEDRPVVRPVVQQQRGELADFARDNQNIHTVRAVNMTKEMVAIILTIPVPTEYKWNPRECSKTPGDIIMTCRLTPKAAWQMAAKYCQDESIYDLEKGIYGKVLDGVWQFVLNSSDKPDLCRVLKQEMEDNIGMCAQGNLSRLCNILAGYMEGIGSQESVADILGRLMPKLMEIEDLYTRLREAYRILKETNVPVPQWKSWVDPLVFDQDAEMEIGFIRNAQDEVTGFIAVVL